MSISGLLTFLLVLYAFFLVGRSMLVNYNSNKDLEKQKEDIIALEEELELMKYQINYFQTNSYKEKQAREKLAYRAPGENVLIVPIDKEEDKIADQGIGEVVIKTPNYVHWWRYYFDR